MANVRMKICHARQSLSRPGPGTDSTLATRTISQLNSVPIFGVARNFAAAHRLSGKADGKGRCQNEKAAIPDDT